MRKVIHGFLLLEFSVYFFLLTFLVTLIGGLLVSSQQRIALHAAQSEQIMSDWFAADRLAGDLRSAPTAVASWKQLRTDCVIWQAGEHDVGWSLEGNTLFRHEGVYHLATNSWHKHVKNMVSPHVQTLLLFPLYFDAKKLNGFDVKVCIAQSSSGKKTTKLQPVVLHRMVAVGGGRG